MVQKALFSRHIMQAGVHRVPELPHPGTNEVEWDCCPSISKFLDTANITVNESASSYVTVSLTMRAYDRLSKSCQTSIHNSANNCGRRPIAERMLANLTQYSGMLLSGLALLAHVADARFRNDVHSDKEILR